MRLHAFSTSLSKSIKKPIDFTFAAMENQKIADITLPSTVVGSKESDDKPSISKSAIRSIIAPYRDGEK